MFINRGGSGSGGIYPNPDHGLPLFLAHALHHGDDGLLHGFDIVEGMVAELVLRGVTKVTTLPARVVNHLGIQFVTILTVDSQYPH
ncbi:hypothetical protein D3C78_1651180 [compost metagenome]